MNRPAATFCSTLSRAVTKGGMRIQRPLLLFTIPLISFTIPFPFQSAALRFQSSKIGAGESSSLKDLVAAIQESLSKTREYLYCINLNPKYSRLKDKIQSLASKTNLEELWYDYVTYVHLLERYEHYDTMSTMNTMTL